MTLIAALRSMGRIVVMSDTMITDENARQPNRIPGRLKSIVLNKWLTVSYAGLSAQALDAIRRVSISDALTTEVAVRMLLDESKKFNGAIDFLVCSHEEPERPRLLKLSCEEVFEGEDFYWIGHQFCASELSLLALPPLEGEAGSDFYSIEERQFTRRFHTYMDGLHHDAVGGMAINCLASPFGHCYQDHLGVYVDHMVIPDPLSSELRSEMNKAGMDGYYRYAVLTAPDRGVGIVGIYFEQAGVGFLHDPLRTDDPEKIAALTQEKFQAAIRERSRQRVMGSNGQDDGR